MKFDIVIGNPPYNNDLYLDFVQLGYQLSSKYTIMITPAKWQAKGGDKNEAFRKEIVPHMSDIVYYPVSQDIFNIQLQGGVAYYLIGKDVITNKTLNVICTTNENISADNDHTDGKLIYSTNVQDIINKVSGNNKLNYSGNDLTKQFVIGITNVFVGGGFLSKKTGDTLMLISPYKQIGTVKKNVDTTLLCSFDTEAEADSYISYLNTRFIRFLFFVACCGMHLNNDFSWRFVPDPGPFDHIFTDEELYKKYNLTPEEINIIESVIKERKQK